MARKVFKDSIHGLVEFDPFLVKIIDTPEFQRLRNIKQLAGCHYVYPGANHNRFQHSLGTCYLAGELVRVLQRQEDSDITNEDVLCVEIAALCHDLGHGPYSHLFDNDFLPKAWKKWGNGEPGPPKHEQLSVDMLKHLLENNTLMSSLKDKNLDLNLINNLILGNKNVIQADKSMEKVFLFDIVNNSDNGIDVDKWDYYARDCHHLGIKNNFDYKHLLLSARVCSTNPTQISYRDKEVLNIYEMFRTRYLLHKRAYQHNVNSAIEVMITEAFLEADEHNNAKKLSEAVTDMEAYSKLTDHVFEEILYSSGDELAKARGILERIVNRQLYKLVGEAVVPDHVDEQAFEEFTRGKAWAGDIVVKLAKMGYTLPPRKPFSFYSKIEPDNAFTQRLEGDSPVLPKSYSEKLIRVYTKDVKTIEEARRCFKNWRTESDFTLPIEIRHRWEMTPPPPIEGHDVPEAS